jgi:hypothetical protein
LSQWALGRKLGFGFVLLFHAIYQTKGSRCREDLCKLLILTCKQYFSIGCGVMVLRRFQSLGKRAKNKKNSNGCNS